MKIGIIGTGSMGSILIESFIEAAVITPSQLIINNRTLTKAEAWKEKYPQINVVSTANDVCTMGDIIFICVKPLQFEPILKQINSSLKSEQIIVSITSPITVEQLQSIVPCKVARAIPSITNRALSGPSLLTFGNRCTEKDKYEILKLMSSISKPVEIRQEITRVASDITSCGPAFLSYIIQEFIAGAVRQTKISEDEATILASEMLIGFGKLLEKEIFTLPTLQKRVTVPGGITGEGIKVLQEEIGEMFDHLFQQTHAKFYDDLEKIEDQYLL